MVGDKIETDIVGGFQAEIGITMWVLPPEGAPAEKPNPPPDFIIADIMELPGILQNGREKARSKGHRSSGKSSSSGACSSSGTVQGAGSSGTAVGGAAGSQSSASSGAGAAVASKVAGQSDEE